jgi:GDP-L-fucose synthase
MEKNAKIYVAGHRGLVGSAITRNLVAQGYSNLLTRTSSELDLTNQQAVDEFFNLEKPDYVFLAAAKVGGILANETYPADFIYINIMIEANIIRASFQSKVKKLLSLGSTCIYPKMAEQPLKEEYLLTGPLEPTNEWYAVAKIAGIKMCQAYRLQHGCDFISAMPTNLYGPGDNFDLESSHVMPALIRKFHEAKINSSPSVTIWGTGKPRREFCHVDDCANACVFLMQNYSGSDIVNIGVGEDVTIKDLGKLVQNTVGYKGDIEFDRSKPDGTPRKLVDVTRIKSLGWTPTIPLEQGLEDTYQWFLQNTPK